MKKWSLYLVVFLAVLGSGSYLPTLLEGPILKEVKQLKSNLSKIESASTALDFKIQEKSNLNSSELSNEIDSLKNIQATLRQQYKSARAKLVELHDKGQFGFISGKLAGNLQIMGAGASLAILLIILGVFKLKNSKPSLSRRKPGAKEGKRKNKRPIRDSDTLMQEKIVPIDSHQNLFQPKRNENKDAVLQSALKGLSEIALQNLDPQPADSRRPKTRGIPQVTADFSDSENTDDYSNEELNPVEVFHFVNPKEEPVNYAGREPEVHVAEVEEIAPLEAMEQPVEQPVEQSMEETIERPVEENQSQGIQVPDFKGKEKWNEYQKEESKKLVVLKLARKGSTVSEISQRLRISKTEIEFMIRSHKLNS